MKLRINRKTKKMDNEATEAAKSIIAGGEKPLAFEDPAIETGEQEPALLELVRSIAREAHASQVDKLGIDYIHHPETVAKQFEERGEWERAAAAWLHDVVEDSDITVEDLLARGVPPRVLEIVDLLTRKDDVSDDEYYKKIAADPDALEVKISDMRHNTDPERQKLLDEPTRVRLILKYIHAAEMLGLDDFAAELRARLPSDILSSQSLPSKSDFTQAA